MISNGEYLDGISDSSSWITITSGSDIEGHIENSDSDREINRSITSDAAIHETESNELRHVIGCEIIETSVQYDSVLSDASDKSQQNDPRNECYQIIPYTSDNEFQDIETDLSPVKSIDEKESYANDIDLQYLINEDDSSDASLELVNLHELDPTALKALQRGLQIKAIGVPGLEEYAQQVFIQRQQQQRVANASVSLSKYIFAKNQLNLKLRILLLLSTVIMSTLSITGIIVGFVYMGNNLWRLSAFAIAAALIPSLYLTILNRIWTIRLYEGNRSINPCLHFVIGLMLAIINMESLYYHLKYRKIVPSDYEHMKMIALLINDCQQLMVFGLISQVAAHLAVQILTVVEHRDLILTLPWIVFIICLTLSAIVTAGILNFSYKFDSILGSEWRVTVLNFILKGPSIALYLLDVFTDWFLVVSYLLAQQWIFAALTLLFITGPSFFITWNSRFYTSYGTRNGTIKIIIGFFNLEPIVQHWNSVKSIFKTKKLEITNQDEDQFNEYKWLARNEFNVQVLISYECYMESTMQFILQLAIAASEREIGVSRLVSIIMSLTSIAISIILLNKKKRISGNVSEDDADPTASLDPTPLVVVLFHFLGTFSTVGPRILVLGVFASISPGWTAVLIIANSALVVIHLMYAKRCINYEQLMACFMAGFASTFKPSESISKKAEIGYHIFYWLQNLAFCYIWYSVNTTVSSHFAFNLFVICIVIPIFGWVCQCVVWKYKI